MYRGLIDYLTFSYSFICKGRGKLTDHQTRVIADGAHAVVDGAVEVLGNLETETADDRADMAEARKINEHIEDMTIFLQSLEIV